MRLASRAAAAVEGLSALDGIGAGLNGTIGKVLKPGRLRDLLSGTPIGHAAHPAVVALPIGLWSSALLTGLAGHGVEARRLTALGVVASVPAAATGLSDWLDTDGPERRVGLVHMAANSAGVAVMVTSWRARTHGHHVKGTLLALAGTAFVGAGGWLGGHLSYGLGVGVDTNAFESGPTDWERLDTGGEDIVTGRLTGGAAGGVALVATDLPDGPAVLADRCSHRGGPLSDGELIGGCVRCPWHGSEFDLRTGEVVDGPASVDQPTYEARRRDGSVEVRRQEARALRLNSVRPTHR